MSTQLPHDVPDSLPLTKARDLLTKLPEQLEKQNRAIALTRRGKPVLALMPWDLYEAIRETLEIMADPQLLALFREGIKEVAEGKTTPWEEVKGNLGV